MSAPQLIRFDSPALLPSLCAASDGTLDELEFGTIGFDAEGIVRRYNRFESEAAGLSLARVVGHPLFTDVAPCMNNFLVAERFHEAMEQKAALDESLPYVLTLRMRPTKVRLRLLADPGERLRFVLVLRTPRAAA